MKRKENLKQAQSAPRTRRPSQTHQQECCLESLSLQRALRLSPLPQQAHGSASPGRGGGGVGVEVVWSSAPKSCADTEIRCCSGPG